MTIRITMSERRPLIIVEGEWPLIASANYHDGQVECQANHEWAIRVRQHADGRRIVYGWVCAGDGGVHAGWRPTHGGFLLPCADPETIRAIRRIGGIIGNYNLADECVADLPAEEI